MGYKLETLALAADRDVTDEKSVAPAIHYSAVFKAAGSEEFAEMSSVPQHPRNYTRYGNPVHERAKAPRPRSSPRPEWARSRPRSSVS